jgi:arabinofuranosyltransferase
MIHRKERKKKESVKLNPMFWITLMIYIYITQPSYQIKMMNSPLHFWICLSLLISVASSYGICTQDDAFISFRYAQNLIQGHGLVFNEGELVEGISNPLWTLLIAVGMFLGMEPVFLSIILGIGSLVWLLWTTSELLEEYKLPQIGLYLLVSDFSLILESVEGLESTFFAAVIGQIWLSLKRFDGSTGLRHIICFFIIALLTRPESPLLIVSCIIAFAMTNRIYHRTTSIYLLLCLLGSICAITFLRFIYYGEILPNTFYAKVGGSAIERGLSYLWLYGKYHLLYALSCLLIPYIAFLRKKQDLEFAYLVIPVFFHVLYIVYIGGDFKPTSRFLLTLSAFFCVISTMFVLHLHKKQLGWLALVLIGFSMYSRSMLWQETQEWSKNRQQNFIARRAAGLFFQKYTTHNQSIAMHSVGAVPFYAQRHCIDMWGLNDKVIARTSVQDFGSGLAGHERTNPTYVFSKEPDFFLPEDNWLQLEKIRQPLTEDLPPQFKETYRAVSVPLGASWLNFWIHKRNLIDGEVQEKGLQWIRYVWEKP